MSFQDYVRALGMGPTPDLPPVHRLPVPPAQSAATMLAMAIDANLRKRRFEQRQATPQGLNVTRAPGGVPSNVTIAPIAQPADQAFQASVASSPRLRRIIEQAEQGANFGGQAAIPQQQFAANVAAQQVAQRAAQQLVANQTAFAAARQAQQPVPAPVPAAPVITPIADALAAAGTQVNRLPDPSTALAGQRTPPPATTQDGTPVTSLSFGGPQAGPQAKPTEAGMLDFLPDVINKENALKVAVPAVKAAGYVLDKPRQIVSGLEGSVFYELANNRAVGLPLGLDRKIHDMLGSEVKAGIIDAHEHGYTSYEKAPPIGGGVGPAPAAKVRAHFEPGDRAVHEYLMGTMDTMPLVPKLAIRAVVDTFEDPWNWAAPLGKIGRGLKAVKRAPDVVGAVNDTTKVERAVGTVLAAPQDVLDIASKVPKYVVGKQIEGLKAIPGVGGVVEKLAAKSPRQLRDEEADRIRQAADEAARVERDAPKVLPDTAFDPTEWAARWKTGHPNVKSANRLIPDLSRVGTAAERIVDKAAHLATNARDNPQMQQAWKIFTDLYDDLAADAKSVDSAVTGKAYPQRVRLEGVAAVDNITNLVTAWKASFGQLGETLPAQVRDMVDGKLALNPKDPVNWMLRYVISTDGKEVRDAAARLGAAGYNDLYKPLKEMRQRWKAVKDAGFGDLLPRVEDPSRPLDYVAPDVRDLLERTVTSRFGTDQRTIDVLGQYGQEAQDLAATIIPRIQQSGLDVKRWSRMSVKDLSARLSPAMPRAQIQEVKNFIETYLPYANKPTELVDDTGLLARRRAADELADSITGYEAPVYSRAGRVARGALNVAPRLARMALNDVTNWAYVARNVLSNEQMANASSTVGLTLAEGGVLKNAARALKRDISGHPIYEFLDNWGVGKGVTEPILGRRGAAGFEGDRSFGTIERWLGMKWKGEVTQAIEDVQRAGTMLPIMKEIAIERLPRFADDIGALAGRFGANADEVRQALLDMPIGNGAGQVHDLVFDLAARAGIPQQRIDNLATRAYRDWANVTHRAANEARDEVRRRFAIGAERNIDRLLNPVAAFHRWSSRAYPYILEEAIRHPGIVNAWVNANQAAREYSEQYPGSLKGSIMVAMTTPLGLSVFFDPTAFSLVSQLWNMADPTEPDDLTEAGTKVRQARKFGVGVWPLILEGFNLTGALGNEYQTGPINLPSGRLALRLVDAIRGQMGEGPHDPVIVEGMSRVRETISSSLEGVVPGIERVPSSPASGGAERDIREVVISQHPELQVQQGDSPQVAEEKIQALEDILSDPDGPAYEQAQKDLGWAKLGQEVWNRAPTGVLAIRTRPTARFEREVRANTGEEKPTDKVEADLAIAGSPTEAQLAVADYRLNPPPGQGISSGEFGSEGVGQRAQERFDQIATDTTATPGEIYWIGDKAWTPAELAALPADRRRELAEQSLTQEGRLDEYQQRTAPQGERTPGMLARDAYNDIAYGADPNLTFAIGGNQWHERELSQLPDKDRRALAEHYLAERGLTDDRAAEEGRRDAIALDTPAQAELEAWRDTMPKKSEELAAWRETTAKDNIQFADMLKDMEGYLKDEGLTPGDPEYQDRLNAWTKSDKVFLFMTGRRVSVYGPEPNTQIAHGASLPLQTLPGMNATPAGFDPAAQLAMEQTTFMAQMDQIDGLLSAHFPYPVRMRDIENPMVQDSMNGLLDAWGVVKPQPSQLLLGYWKWKEAFAEDPNADTSPTAYVTWYRQWMASGTGQIVPPLPMGMAIPGVPARPTLEQANAAIPPRQYALPDISGLVPNP